MQYRLVAAVLAAATLATGLYLTRPHHAAHRSAAPHRHTPAPRSTPAVSSPRNIDALLPMSHRRLRAAIKLATRFVAARATYRYTQPTRNYLERLRPMVTSPMYGQLARSAATPGLRTARRRDHQTATATASPVTIRMLASSSVIVLVIQHQKLHATAGHRRRTTRLSVTIIATNHRCKVSNLEPADAGNAGSTADAR